MSEKEYIARGEALSELRSGFFPQDVVYTEAVSIAEQIIRAAPAADVVPRSQIAKIFEEIDESTKYFRIPDGCAIISLKKLDELKKKYAEDQKNG